ncbi:MAG: 30S ribosome-binding factor RbfA [Pseudomonadales bacterium]|nr:30S ribosome-binding factor RbfA [Pseudomonadales bacterium]
MAREFGRPERVADFLRKELSQILQQQMRDPRVGLASITDVEVSRDLGHAKVYVTVLGSDKPDDAQQAIAVLNKAAGFFRSQVAKEHSMRITPTLRFYFDESVHRGQHLSALIDKALAEDRARADDETGSSDSANPSHSDPDAE